MKRLAVAVIMLGMLALAPHLFMAASGGMEDMSAACAAACLSRSGNIVPAQLPVLPAPAIGFVILAVAAAVAAVFPEKVFSGAALWMSKRRHRLSLEPVIMLQ
jgi:hypothetical protein